jgi:hypothetical protein
MPSVATAVEELVVSFWNAGIDKRQHLAAPAPGRPEEGGAC